VDFDFRILGVKQPVKNKNLESKTTINPAETNRPFSHHSLSLAMHNGFSGICTEAMVRVPHWIARSYEPGTDDGHPRTVLSPVDMPSRIQRKRTPGRVKPEGVHIVDRTTIFGNPYKVGDPGVPDQATATRPYERDLLTGNLRGYKRPNVVITVETVQEELRGFDLAWFCETQRRAMPCGRAARNRQSVGHPTR
jgi:uncharacterized protein DUF4326